jgi:hypothetical protein
MRLGKLISSGDTWVGPDFASLDFASPGQDRHIVEHAATSAANVRHAET